MKFAVHFEGSDQLVKALSEMPLRTQGTVLREALTEGAEPIRTVMAAMAPRSDEPPHVGDNIVIGSTRAKGMQASIAVGPSRDFDDRAKVYPSAQEFGSVHHAPQPFARPAFDQAGPKALQPIANALWRALIARGFGSARTSGGGGLL